MGSFSRIAAEVLSEFLGGADKVVAKGSDDLVATSVKANPKSITKSSLDDKIQYMSSDDSFVSKRIIEKPKGTKPYEEFETGYETKFRVLDSDDPDVLSDIARKNGTFPIKVQKALLAWNKNDGGMSSKELRKILKEEGWADMLDLRQLAADAKYGATDLLPPKSFDPEQKALRFEFNKGGIVKKRTNG